MRTLSLLFPILMLYFSFAHGQDIPQIENADIRIQEVVQPQAPDNRTQNNTYQVLPNGNKPGKTISLVFIGNSITAGAGLRNRAQEAPPVFAAGYLKNFPEVGRVDFANQGVSGYTTVDFLPGRPAYARVVQTAQNLRTREGMLIFSVSLGTNDSASEGPNGSPVSPADYKNNLRILADSLLKRFPGCLVVFHRPLWYSPNTQNTSRYLAEGLTRLQTYFPALEQLVEEYQSTHPGKVFHGDKDGFGFFEANHLTDFQAEPGRQGTFYLHPNARGAENLGRLWGTAIARALSLTPPKIPKPQTE